MGQRAVGVGFHRRSAALPHSEMRSPDAASATR